MAAHNTREAADDILHADQQPDTPLSGSSSQAMAGSVSSVRQIAFPAVEVTGTHCADDGGDIVVSRGTGPNGRDEYYCGSCYRMYFRVPSHPPHPPLLDK